MPLKLKLRGKVWHLEGRIDEIPNSPYHRKSTRRTEKKNAQTFLDWFKRSAIKAHYGEIKTSFIFAEAVTLYDATPEFAGYLMRVMPYLEEMQVEEITPKMVKDLAKVIRPMNSTDTWHKQVIVPVRAVINNAHQLGLCHPIKIKTYTKDERQRQDRIRGKESRVPKTPGSWEWLFKFQSVADPHTGLLAEFMFQTAARISQAVALTPHDMDYQGMRFNISGSKGKSKQWVPLTPELSAALQALPPKKPRYIKGRTKKYEARVFGYARKDSVRNKWKRYCREAGIEIIMPHGAGRHGFATELLVRQGQDVSSVASAGRWSDKALLLKTYVHSEDTDRKVIQAFRTGRAQAEKARQSKSLKNTRK